MYSDREGEAFIYFLLVRLSTGQCDVIFIKTLFRQMEVVQVHFKM